MLAKLKNYLFNDISIVKRLLIFFLAISIFPLSCVGIVSYYIYTNEALNNTFRHMTENDLRIMAQIDEQKVSIDLVANQLLSNLRIQDYLLSRQLKNNTNIVEKSYLNNLLAGIPDYKKIISVVIFDENGVIITSNTNFEFFNSNFSLKKSKIYKNSCEAENRVNKWIYEESDIFNWYNDRAFIYIYRSMYSLDYPNAKIGTSMIQCDDRLFEDIINLGNLADGEYYIIADDANRIITSTVKINNAEMQSDEFFATNIGNHKQGRFFANIDDNEYLITFNRSTSSGWLILHYTPYSIVIKKSKDIGKFTLVVMFFVMLLACLFALRLSRSITLPISKLEESMAKYGKGDFHIELENMRNDEIGRLQDTFVNMAEEIKNLLNRVEEKHKQMRALEMKMIEYQISPHFLYNTLDSINWLAQANGNKDVSHMITALARYFRIGLSNGHEFHSIKEELEHVNNYLIIYKMRFKDCFNFDVIADESILHIQIIKTILQPIVENSIKYGIDKNRSDNRIVISVSSDHKFICFSVADNGPGIMPEVLESIKHNLSASGSPSASGGGFGLINVNKRLKLNYGENCGIEIRNNFDKGITTRIFIPIC